jgi:hypothetical protein
VAQILLLPSWFWASVWLALSILLFLYTTWTSRVEPAVGKN